jgi:hypothetical protein
MVELHTEVLRTSVDMAEKKHSSLALKTALQITRDITLMDDINELERMPLAAVVLLRKAVAAFPLLDGNCQSSNHILGDLHKSLQRAKARWQVASRII